MIIKKEKEFVDRLNESIVGEKIFIWGAGEHTKDLLDVLEKYNFQFEKIKGIIDSDIKKDGQKIYNINIYYKEKFFEDFSKKCSDIIISSTFENEIFEGLIQKTSNINIIKMHDGVIGELIDGPKYGTKKWFEQQFSENEGLGDKWGQKWRASQKLRHNLCLKMIDGYLKDNINILDIGCALGDFTTKLQLLNKNNKVYAIDISENAIKENMKKCKYIKFEYGELPKLKYKNDSFDFITCLEVLYYLDDKKRIEALKEIKRVLKNQGKLFISVVINNNERYFEEEDIVELVSTYFKIIKLGYNYGYLYYKIESKFLNITNTYSKKSFKYKFAYLFLCQVWIVKTCKFISELLYKNKAKTHIFILAER